jgi:sigma-B regulation protein RsbU (phosphoserine phosphatase)
MDFTSLLEKVGSLEDKLIDLDVKLESKNAELIEIAHVGAMITSILELDNILSAMMEISLRLLEAEVGCILSFDKGKVDTRVSWGIDNSLVQMIKLEGDMDIAQWTRGTGETVIINEFPPENEIPAQITSVISAPLNCHDETIGVLVAVNKSSEDGFGDDDRAILETLVNFASVAIENSKLLQERIVKQKLEDELSLANEVQKALLPSGDYNIEGAAVSHIYFPAGHVGGDYYDIIPITSREFVVIVGDVSNKGVPAALMMTAVRSVVRHEVRSNTDVALIMNKINQTLCQDVMRRDGMFISLVLAHYDIDKMEMNISNAGHLPPLFYNPWKGEIKQLMKGGVILGQFEECEYVSELVKLEKNDKLLMFTDGITETENVAGQMYGREGLLEFTKKNKWLDDRKFLNKLKQTIDEFSKTGAEIQFDDITSVMVSVK